MTIAVIFEQFGPYHHARVAALQAASADPVIPAQMAAQTTVYEWSNAGPVECEGLVTLCPGSAEALSSGRLFFAARRFFLQHKIECALLPSYAPASSLAVLLAAMSCGVRRVMMNESHAGTERASGWRRVLKRWLVGRFHAALVGGVPQKRHFTALGMDPGKIFVGYDAIDNEFFARKAARIRQNREDWRTRLGLPSRYVLSLGRMVEKKNLGCLIDAYAALRQRLGEDIPALVFVGSGEQEPLLREQCTRLGLSVTELAVNGKSEVRGRRSEVGDRKSEIGDRKSEIESPTTPQEPETKNQKPRTKNYEPEATNKERGKAAIHFYGFRQIEENPIFYALADCFVLPSLWEEWGLVVNEAMACGLPVVVSETVGSAEDLVLPGDNGFHFDPTRPETLAEALALLESDPELRTRMGARSQAMIAEWGCQRFASGALEAVRATSV